MFHLDAVDDAQMPLSTLLAAPVSYTCTVKTCAASSSQCTRDKNTLIAVPLLRYTRGMSC
eukprot:8433-Heterococcus_DN1.PRE.2